VRSLLTPAIQYRNAYNRCVTPSKVVRKVAEADFPTRWGNFRIIGFEGHFESSGERRKETAVALVMGDIHSTAPLVRVHSQCLTGDVFGSLRCDCRAQLEMALSLIAEAGAGILLYEQQEGRGIGLMAKL
jgi:GTP cyclohydrolase II